MDPGREVAPIREQATLRIPGTPPSFNKVGYRSHWAVGRNEKLKWEGWIGIALMEQKVPRNLAFVEVTAELRFKQRRRRDEGNFRVILEKACGDALVSGGYLPDDDAELYRFGRLEISAPHPEPLTIIRLNYA